MHFIGIKPGRWKDIQLIEESGLFDEAHYRNQVQLAPGASAVLHYVYAGAKKGINPHPCFDGEWYLLANPDVAAFGFNPFVHFVERGMVDDRDPHPLFDLSWYMSQNPEVEESGLHPVLHYMRIGHLQNLITNPVSYFLANPGGGPPIFDGEWYRGKNADVADAGLDPLLHFLRHGRFEGRDPNPSFNMKAYLKEHPDLNVYRTNPLLHSLKLEIPNEKRS
jgi:hypothetical protein